MAHLIFAKTSSIENIKKHAVLMKDVAKEKNLETWVIGEPLEIQGDDALSYVMKIWPTQEKPQKMLSSDFNEMIEDIGKKHC